WDECIETALEQARAVVVIVSPTSATSKYVRAEVNEALRCQKTVVPVIVDATTLPLRWRMLQTVNWRSSSTAAARKLARGLPPAAGAKLREALNDRSRFDEVRKLLLQHTEWLPIEYRMRPVYTYKRNALALRGSRIDCFAGRLDTIGPRACLYYFGSPYSKPIYASGALAPGLQKLLNVVRDHRAMLGRELRGNHGLAPKNVFSAEAHEWKEIQSHYTLLKIHIIVGRRAHLDQEAKVTREHIVSSMNEELFPREAFRGGGL